MNEMRSNDVGFALAEIGKAAEVAVTMFPAGHQTAADVQTDALALLQAWEIDDADELVDEIIGRLKRTLDRITEQPGGSKVWVVLQRKLAVGRAFVDIYRGQQLAKKTAPGIDDEAGR